MAVQTSDLEKIVGKDKVVDDKKTLKSYSQDQSFASARMPDYAVIVENSSQIQDVIKLANESATPVIPYSSGMNLHGATIPDQGGIMIDMSKMKKISNLDKDNWHVQIEPGVTFAELQAYLEKEGFRAMIPFGAPPERSALTSYLERDPVLAAANFETGNTILMDTEVVLANGEIFKTGNWASGGDPGSPAGPIRNRIYRMFTAAQGTMGIMTKMVVQIEPIQKMRKIFFIPFKSLAEAIEPIRRIQRKEIGNECLLLNKFNFASLLTDAWDIPETLPAAPVATEEFKEIQKDLSQYTMIICLNGHLRRPEEKIAYEAEALKEICDDMNIELLETLPNIPGAENIMMNEINKPFKILKKFNYKGSVQSLCFKAPLNKITELEEKINTLAISNNYAVSDIGIYLLPMERARAIHCEFDLHCTSADESSERKEVESLWLKASSELINNGAYFDRPYGPWADMMYSRASDYVQMLKKLKKETDPNNILNPGKLCFS